MLLSCSLLIRINGSHDTVVLLRLIQPLWVPLNVLPSSPLPPPLVFFLLHKKKSLCFREFWTVFFQGQPTRLWFSQTFHRLMFLSFCSDINGKVFAALHWVFHTFLSKAQGLDVDLCGVKLFAVHLVPEVPNFQAFHLLRDLVVAVAKTLLIKNYKTVLKSCSLVNNNQTKLLRETYLRFQNVSIYIINKIDLKVNSLCWSQLPLRLMTETRCLQSGL